MTVYIYTVNYIEKNKKERENCDFFTISHPNLHVKSNHEQDLPVIGSDLNSHSKWQQSHSISLLKTNVVYVEKAPALPCSYYPLLYRFGLTFLNTLLLCTDLSVTLISQTQKP